MDEMPDNWLDLRHKGENLLVHFPDNELQSELDRRLLERRKIEIIKIVKERESFAYYTSISYCDGGHTTEWELNVIFTDGSKEEFVFNSKSNQTEETMNEFREIYFPNLTCFNFDDYIRFKKAKEKSQRKKGNNNKTNGRSISTKRKKTYRIHSSNGDASLAREPSMC